MSLGYELFMKQNEKSIKNGDEYAEYIISEIEKIINDSSYFSPFIRSVENDPYAFIITMPNSINEIQFDSMQNTFEINGFTLMSEEYDGKPFFTLRIDKNEFKKLPIREKKRDKKKNALLILGCGGVLLTGIVIGGTNQYRMSGSESEKTSSAQMMGQTTEQKNEKKIAADKIYQNNEWAPITVNGKTAAKVRIVKATTKPTEFPDYLVTSEADNLSKLLYLTIEYTNDSLDEAYSPNRYQDFSFYSNNQMLHFNNSWDGGEHDIAKSRTGVMTPTYLLSDDVDRLEDIEIDFSTYLPVSDGTVTDADNMIHFDIKVEH